MVVGTAVIWLKRCLCVGDFYPGGRKAIIDVGQLCIIDQLAAGSDDIVLAFKFDDGSDPRLMLVDRTFYSVLQARGSLLAGFYTLHPFQQ